MSQLSRSPQKLKQEHQPSEAMTPAASRGLTRKAVQGFPFDVQAKMLAPVQKTGASVDGSAGVQELAQQGTSGAGGPLPFRDQIAASFGHHDVSGIQAHVGGAAGETAQAMGARAYASGTDVVFAGQPDLHTSAHEAAHVIQQRTGVSLKGGVGQQGDPYEQHADRVADAVVAGRSAAGILDEMAGGGGTRGVQRRAVQLKTEKERAHEQEAADDGHSLLRHGPEVTEDALKRRLKTGMTAKIGDPSLEVYSPAPGIATKFKTYADYNTTRQKATDTVNAAITTTKAEIRQEVEAWNTQKKAVDDAKAALDQAKSSGVGVAEAGKAFAKSRAPLAVAESTLRSKANTFAAANVDGVSLSFNKAGNEATGWDFLTLKPSYKCVIDHGGAIGVGFRGEDQKTLAQGNADNDTIYNDVSDPFDVATTQTAFSGTGSKKLADVDDSTEAQSWKAGQHYPCDPGESVGVSG